MNKHLFSLALATMAAVVIAPPTFGAATTKPSASTTKPSASSDKAGLDAIHKAVIAMTKEYQTFESDPKATIQTDSNYFKKNPSTDVTQALIIKALSVNYGNDVPTDAYVKWQLLSAVPGKFDDDLQPQAGAIYVRISNGVLVNNPGLDHRTLDGAISRLNSSTTDAKITQIDDQLDASVVKAMKANAPILAYHDRLFATLSPTQDVCAAGLQDVVNRMTHGMDPQEIGTTFMAVKASITEWATDATPAQLQVVSNALMKFLVIEKNQAYVPYTKIVKDAKGYHWDYGQILNPSYYTDLAASLQKDASNPQGQLGFKKDDK